MRASHSMPAWVSHCEYSTCSCRHLVPDTDTPHHHLLPGILRLQKMAPRAGCCFTSPQGSQGIPHSVQSPGWGHPPTKQGRGSSPSPAASDNSVGSRGSRGSRHRSHSCAPSITPTHSWRSGSVGLAAGHHSVRSHTTEGGEVSSSKSELSHDEEDIAGEDEMLKQTRAWLRLQAMARWH